MPTLYIIDAYAQFFRAYHAIRTPLTSPVTKEPTNMTFGFVGMLLKLLRAREPGLQRAGRPDYLAVALDVSDDRGTFRSQLYPDYKAHRPPPPEDLRPQVDRCLAMLREVGVPIVGAAGFEADDVIATLVRQLRAKHPDLHIRIISKDKDLKQLLQPSPPGAPDAPPVGPVALFDVHTDAAVSAESFEQETGLKPSQVVDMLALMGDAADNVPGVDGVGEKTAAALIKEWGSLDNLLSHASEIKGKRGEKLREASTQLDLARRLVTLRDDVPVDFSLEAARIDALRLDRLMPILKECGFNRYQDELRALLGQREVMPLTSGAGAPPAPAPKQPRPPDAGGFESGLFAQVEAKERAAAPRTAQAGDYRCVRTMAELQEVARALRSAPVVSLDTETTSLSPRDARLCGLCLAIEPGRGWYIPVRSPTPQEHLDERTVLDVLRPMLEDPARIKCGHNLKYDLLVLRNAGVELRGASLAPGVALPDERLPCDSMVASYLIDASRSSHSLDALALALLGRTNISISELIGSGKEQRTFDTVPLDLATQYAAEDADVALQLRGLMMPRLRAMELMPLMQDVEMPLVEVLAELEWNGISVDPAELDRQRVRLQAQIETIHAAINREAKAALGRTFDPDSPRQLAAALFNKPDDETPGLGITGTKRTKTGYSTDAEVLQILGEDDTIATPIPRLILEYRQLTKLVSTYLVALRQAIHPATGRIHASFHQTVAATGRLASSDPNLQNIPIRTDVGRDIRRAFVAPAGRVLITADYSQIELRLLAHLSKDPGLIEAFEQGADIHAQVAAQIHAVPLDRVTKEQRNGAKMVNFGIVYGITPFGLARRLKVPQEQAAEIIAAYKKRFSGITTFLQECVEQARTHGFVTTILGRRRPIPDIDSNNPARRSLAERLAINSVVQGSAADLIKVAMVDLHRRIDAACPRVPGGQRAPGSGPLAGVLMLLQIHDELVFEAPEDSAPAARDLIVERMERAMSLDVPLRADAHIGRTWFEGK